MEKQPALRAWKFKVLAVLAIAATLSLGFYMYQGKNIILQVEDEITEIVSYSNNIEDFLLKEDILFKEGGYINIPLDTKLEENMHIVIKNPKSYMVRFGETMDELQSVHSTVDKILNDLGIQLEGKDYVEPDLDTKIGPNSTIEIFRVKEVLESVETVIPFEKLVNKNKKLDKGLSNEVQKGQDGLRKTDYKKVYINGELDSTTIIGEEIISEAIPQIVEKGTKEKVVATTSRGTTATSRGTTAYKKVITMNASAYDLSFQSTGKRPGDKYYGITASGTKARPGVVAVDPRVIPLGTKLYIESTDGTKDYGFAIAEDKGGAIKGNKIDLFFETASQVKNFGRRNVKVYVLP